MSLNFLVFSQGELVIIDLFRSIFVYSMFYLSYKKMSLDFLVFSQGELVITNLFRVIFVYSMF